MKDENLTALDAEREARKMRSIRQGARPRGAPTTVRRFAIGSTRVQITFRKRDVTSEDVLQVLDETITMLLEVLSDGIHVTGSEGGRRGTKAGL